MPSKAKKTQNKKSTKAARRAVTAGKTLTKGTQNIDEDVKCAPKDFNEESEWEIEQFGGLYLCWGKKKVRKEDGSIGREYYLKDDKDHRIWIKWTVAFHDKIRWSAEKQSSLIGVSKDAIKKIVNDKKAWPMPSASDGVKTGWKERRAICSNVGITEWAPSGKEAGKRYNLVDPELPITQSEIEDTDEETDEEDSSN
ncbi:Oidioi.mRNA.OKI2018_I69.chr2.g7197.t1.cds [Oikopleura dioica]|uniref:Oidioi.mRNA.OKI2018_I69.chr2.g7197.t1.cds n=1 Tax=Oikopleura dioica TaxID=34765 RepID=A0ABN7TCC3_OIKDI|nr:Oidioi.mRNA.OKI2018_I69.chr2.g7197.t1.cds [Oikopleura dioica]